LGGWRKLLHGISVVIHEEGDGVCKNSEARATAEGAAVESLISVTVFELSAPGAIGDIDIGGNGLPWFLFDDFAMNSGKRTVGILFT
jgi:hypothetical protein